MANNKGFSLIELIVTVLIMGMFSLIVLSFADTSLTVYRIIGKEETLQTEAATAVCFITEVMESAENSGYSGLFTTATGKQGECIWVKRPGDRYGFILYDKAARCLRYKEFTFSEFFGTDGTVWNYAGKLESLFGDPYYLLADKVDDITFATSSITNATGKLATITLTMRFLPEDSDDDIYKTSFKVVNRNADN